MFYIEDNNKILLFDDDKQRLQNTIALTIPQYQSLEIKEVQEGYTIDNFKLKTIEQTEQEQSAKEAERIAKLKMTRGDLFEYTIVTKGLDSSDIRAMVEQEETLDAITKKLYLNRLDNALHFFRGHPAVDFIGKKLGLTKEDLDMLFEEKGTVD